MDKSRLPFSEIIRFLIVGCINTLIGSGVMFILYNLFNVNYWISTISNYVVGSIVSFFLNKFYTFKKQEFSKKEILSFICNICICYSISYGLARPIARLIFSSQSKTIQDNIAMLTGMIVFTGLNYIGQKFFVFKGNKNENQK